MKEHYVAVIGAAVAGSEAALMLSRKDVGVVVFEQFDLPYGKIESGLPKWHYKLRDKQQNEIDEKLDHPLVKYIPRVKLGHDIQVGELLDEWGFSAVLLATGAWKDRPLPVPGLDEYEGRGLLTSNKVVQWFNHCHDPEYTGERYTIPDGTFIIGGGLASLDMAKIAMIKSVQDALIRNGHELADALTLEHTGILPYLESRGLTLEKLGLKGCTLVVRSSLEEMPLTPIPADAGPEVLEKAGTVRRKMIEKVTAKYGFKLLNNRELTGFGASEGRITAITLRSTAAGEENLTEDLVCPLLISSIGSIPEPIPGIPMKGEIYDVKDIGSGMLNGSGNIFALGNAVTGRGNIQESRIHSRRVSETIIDQYLSLEAEDYGEIFDAAKDRAEARIGNILDIIESEKNLTGRQIEELESRVGRLQETAGYSGNYRDWISAHLPLRLENIGIGDH